jgi:hypothetical protein
MRSPNADTCNADAPPPDRAQVCACRQGAEAELVAYQMAALRELSDTGLEFIAGLRAQVRESGGVPTDAETLALQRLGRILRLTLAMQTLVLTGEISETAGAVEPVPTPPTPRAARKAELDETLQAVLQKETDKPFLERRTREMRERLTDLADREDFLNRPRGEIIARICRDLGLDIDWRGWWDGPEWALEAAEAEGIDPNTTPPLVPMSDRSPRDRAKAIMFVLAKAAAEGPGKDSPEDIAFYEEAKIRFGLAPRPKPPPGPAPSG